MKPKKYVVSPEAKQDVIEILDYGLLNYLSDRAFGYHDGLVSTFEIIVKFPYMGEIYEDHPKLLRHYAYRSHIIFYAIEDDYIHIVRVFNGRQNYKAYFEDY